MPDRQPQTSADTRPAPAQPPDKTERHGLKSSEAEVHKNKWDLIDENAWESFPASDAPGSWAGRDLTPEERAARKAKYEKERGPKS